MIFFIKSLFGLLVMVFSINAFSTEACWVVLPEECHEIMDSEFSTGGGDKLFWIIEVGCKTQEGNYKKFLASRASPSSLFGSVFSRWTVPKEINFDIQPVEEAEMKCD